MYNRSFLAATVVATLIFWAFTDSALAWGPHPDIGKAAGRALAKDDPFMVYIDNDINSLGNMSWMGDWAAGAAIVGVRGKRIQTQDVFIFPGFPPDKGRYPGHGDPSSGSYEILFRRAIQAMRTETVDNFMAWLGTVLHDTQDTGAPPHAAYISGPLHTKMENWVDGKKIDITGHKPKLLGKTEDEAVKGYIQRMDELHEFAKKYAEKIKPLAEADDREACEPLILECALEAARANADLLHTLGYLQSQMKPVPTAGGLAGNIQAKPHPERLTAKIMLQGTLFSTLSDLEGRYEFRNLPPGEYTMIVMYPQYKPKTMKVSVEADKQTTHDIELEESGNMLRNGDLSVSWARPSMPDTWRRNATPTEITWRSEPIFAKPGQAVNLVVKWKPDAEGHAVVVWDGKPGKDNIPLKAGTESAVFQSPDDMSRPVGAHVYFKSKVELTDLVESVSLTLEDAP